MTMTYTAKDARDLLDLQWKKTIQVVYGLKPVSLSAEYEETHVLLNLLDRKIKAVISIGTVVHGRGDDYEVCNFEGSLLGGLNDYIIDIDFGQSPITYFQVSSAVLQRLSLLHRLLRLAYTYFQMQTSGHPLYDSYVNTVYPHLLSWIEVCTKQLSEV